MSDSQFVIFSIGNPGAIARHSCGHLVLKAAMEHFGAKQLQKSGVYSSSSINNITFVKSNCYMNESEKALKRYFEANKKRPDSAIVIVLYDDFELDLGRVRISQFKKNESHNGVKSVSRVFQEMKNFYKLGVGIGPKPVSATKDTIATWVLSNFRLQEKEVLEQKGIPLAIDYLEYIVEAEGEVADCNKVNAYFTKAR
ncbi:peptidyl-tRNA hydrolase [Yamadazyma tenuis]|uniref:Peptidyl-tRNA hydrolase n=1 Tax=Candida tenuis (strain ATCC 10573 / BCRC 21748 / CBS 615 / JCM 9827 / NBRC 10315 / NRRL Y-1498 / VKM Y-70) TaxID=590646 RepID=G3BCD1_CANTC|nr:peptidyl-tRNA hydrolase [Yamadazyma tenuis ATCC 10573]XP_006690477.1 uncharacterized protein CANTEDRAFT_116872 [Yamadazyma tenuis ATCC 10573]EGV61262.1 peptidyl-tRNA hydrolase [Yamadazyma tenuis ATCC 10573]EGV61263.1 hypothetical protein CANTEDRAFT_116872 [Yamadazyma tenuis ATCC 10573]WEJ93925.1 peptidyl-tRNA hydrolase [Yamadazyma tenuis]